jgi:hypothetical protein
MTAAGTFALDTSTYQTALTNPVTGPGSATANDAATFTGTGDQVQDSYVPIYVVNGNINIGGALPLTSTSNSNIAIGTNSLISNTGNGNLALGFAALTYNSTGYGNIAVGFSPLADNRTGYYNTAVGDLAGDNSNTLTNNSYSTFIGEHANTSVNNLTNAMALGNGAQATASNQVVIGNAAVTDEYFGSAAGLATLHGAAFTGNAGTATNLSTSGTANQVWGMNSGATAQGWQTPGSTMTYPGANTIGVANSGNTAWRTPLYSDITALFGSGSCSGLLKSDGTCVLASTLNVNSALTASNVQCYLQDTCPNDAIWQAPWLTTAAPYLATGYPLGSTDTTIHVASTTGWPATGHLVTTLGEELGYSGCTGTAPNITCNISRAKHGTTAAAVSVGVGNMVGVVSETAACSTCGILMQTVNTGGTTFGAQTNAGLTPTVGGSYAVFDNINDLGLANTSNFINVSSGGSMQNSGYGAGSFDASGAAAARAAVGNCSAGQYGTATTTSGLTCAQVAYSQVSGTPSIPSVGTWGALNYPTWASGTPFVKMTAAGTFALDTNTYLTSLPSTVVQTNQGNTYGAYAQNFGSTTMTLPSSVTQGGYTTTFPAATGTLAIGGGCSAGQYMYGNNLTTACSQVAYSQLTGTPTLGNWAALNYPPWASGTPFVKMTGAGTFSLDTNIYLTSSAIASTTNLLSGDGSGNAVSSGIAASNVPLLNAANTFTATNTFNNATYSALFTGGNVGIGTTSPGAKLNVYDVDANLYNKTGMDVNVAYGNPGGGKTTTALSIGVPNLGTNTNSLTSYGLYIDDIYSYYGLNSPTDNDNFGLYVKGGANNYIQGNVSIGDTTATSMFNVGTANQFQVTSTGVSSAGAGSTDLNGSGVPEVHCLADGTGGCVTLGGAVSCSNVTLGSGAGTGASCNSVIGHDSGHSIEITTGTTPAGSLATLFTFAFTTSRSEKPVCAVVPELYQYTLMSQVPLTLSGGSTTIYSVISGSTAVPASTSLNFQVVCN